MIETLLTLGALGSLGIAAGAGAFAWSARSAVQRLTERANATERQYSIDAQANVATRNDTSHAGHELIGLADAARAQAEAMVRVAELSAQGLRASTGTYVFQLRDRFDEAFPVPQLGSAGGTWSVPGFDAPVESVIFHAGDQVRFTMSLVCNQAPLRRIITVRPGAVETHMVQPAHEVGVAPGVIAARGIGAAEQRQGGSGDAIVVAKTRFVATAAQTLEGESFEIASDTTIFAEIGVDFDIAALGLGRFVVDLPVVVQVANNRPEGAVSELMIGVHIEGTVVPDDDGFGLDAASGDATISGEIRSYYLDKASRLPLAMPTDAPSLRV
jgi:hypothetical protein